MTGDLYQNDPLLIDCKNLARVEVKFNEECDLAQSSRWN